MKSLKSFKEDIHKCSKCGLCQAACPIYEITGNDCTVSKGQFIMLRGFLKGDLKMTKPLNKYLDLCLKCNKCKEFCPSGIDAVDIIVSAKYEHFRKSKIEKLKTFLQKNIIFGFFLNILKHFSKNKKSKSFDKKVIYFGGCGGKLIGNNAIVSLLNDINIEVITPNFDCCGIPYYTRGDIPSFEGSIRKYIKILKQYDINEVVTSCASCEKALKSYIKWSDNDEDKNFLSKIKIKNIYEYLRENNCKFRLKNKFKVTYHKPCNLHNYDDIEYILNSTDNLDYIKSENFDKCCGFNGITKPSLFSVMSKIFESKRKDIETTGAEIILTSCMGCEVALKLFSKGKYKVCDLFSFLNKNK